MLWEEQLTVVTIMHFPCKANTWHYVFQLFKEQEQLKNLISCKATMLVYAGLTPVYFNPFLFHADDT